MTTTDGQSPPHRLFLVSIPRTASNLLVKVLNIHGQPNITTNDKAGYFFHPAYMNAVNKGYYDKPVDQWTGAEKAEWRGLFQHCLDDLEAASARARQDNKIIFTKEHAFWFANPATLLEETTTTTPSATSSAAPTPLEEEFRLSIPSSYGGTSTYSPNNKTIFSDEYLSTWQFAFLIRHPALAWPSMYRAMQKMAKLGSFPDEERGIVSSMLTNMTWRWTRELFDWCCTHSERKPPIIDAHDVAHNPDVVLCFCELAGLERDVVRFSWEDGDILGMQKGPTAAPVPEALRAAAEAMTATLRASKGVIKDKTPEVVDIDAEVEKWKAEFGVEAAGLLERTVREAMADYEYLRERRVKV